MYSSERFLLSPFRKDLNSSVKPCVRSREWSQFHRKPCGLRSALMVKFTCEVWECAQVRFRVGSLYACVLSTEGFASRKKTRQRQALKSMKMDIWSTPSMPRSEL